MGLLLAAGSLLLVQQLVQVVQTKHGGGQGSQAVEGIEGEQGESNARGEQDGQKYDELLGLGERQGAFGAFLASIRTPQKCGGSVHYTGSVLSRLVVRKRIESFSGDMSMTRYHINPETGNPNKCRAKTTASCKFAPKDGEPPPHYATAEEAREAYAQEQKEAPTVGKALRKAPPVLSGSLKGVDPLSPEFAATSQQRATSVVRALADEKGTFGLVASYDSSDPKGGEYFFLGSGVERNVYVDEREDFVYKVRNDFYGDRIAWKDYHRQVQERWALVADEVVKAHGARMANTYFLTVPMGRKKVLVEMQEYLALPRYKTPSWKDVDDSSTIKRLYESGFYDLHSDNVRMDVETGEIVILDFELSPPSVLRRERRGY